MHRHIHQIIILISAALLAGCAHQDLKAPCSDSDAPSSLNAYAANEDQNAAKAFEYLDEACGPLRKINTRN